MTTNLGNKMKGILCIDIDTLKSMYFVLQTKYENYEFDQRYQKILRVLDSAKNNVNESLRNVKEVIQVQKDKQMHLLPKKSRRFFDEVGCIKKS